MILGLNVLKINQWKLSKMAFKRPVSISPSPASSNEDASSSESNSCKVCGDEARLINYGALTCYSCKTFFRRNGFRSEVCS